ncbi:sirohydrochlorin ferrochelatase, chloroplastic isoform X2 [Ricinus communis]|uniref:sirohydrochlorin ferrochelatase, chloroplastic isoform X2 n=1 Tax=Ricinus communis TaxID=3988 RepID=UPI0007728985|nr:sirohydrochlorin ferrochelatase, chloroplastic isoform X2 [Ricinus communis]|eukprot:XP_015578171.1 sirohydrochlorin ferrochelatase, chloroplastic isoform X2 [Ricinus communis]
MSLKFLSMSLPLQITVNNSASETGASYKWTQPAFAKFPTCPSKTKYLSSRMYLSTANSGFTDGIIGDEDGLIIVDHGSRRKESNLMLNEFVNMFRDRTGYPIVEPAHMELAEPSIKDAFGLCVQQGANRVIVSPFFLFPGRHWHQDIPSLTAEAAKEHPGVSYIVTAPLGLHELLVDVLNDRIEHCLSHVAGDADECAACVGTGKCKLY